MDFSRGYVIYRDTAAGEPFDPSSPLLFFPSKDSDELFFALKAAYPSVSTHSERMRNAVIEFLLAEGNSQQTTSQSPFMDGLDSTFDSTTTSPQSLWQDSSSDSTTYSPELSDNASPSIYGPSSSSTQLSSHVLSMTAPPAIDQMTSVFSLSTHVQPKSRTKRKMTEDEKATYRRRRQVGACAKCKLQKRKCVHLKSDAKPALISAVSTPQLSEKAAGKRPQRPASPPINPTEPLFTPTAGFESFDLGAESNLFEGMDDLISFDDLIDFQPSTLLNKDLLDNGDHVGLYHPHPTFNPDHTTTHPSYNTANDMSLLLLEPTHTFHTHSLQSPPPSSSSSGHPSTHSANVNIGLESLFPSEPLATAEQPAHSRPHVAGEYISTELAPRKPMLKRRLPNTLHSDVSGSQPTRAGLSDSLVLSSNTHDLHALCAQKASSSGSLRSVSPTQTASSAGRLRPVSPTREASSVGRLSALLSAQTASSSELPSLVSSTQASISSGLSPTVSSPSHGLMSSVPFRWSPPASTDLSNRTFAGMPCLAEMMVLSCLQTARQMQAAFVLAVSQLAERSEAAEKNNAMCAGINALTLVEV